MAPDPQLVITALLSLLAGGFFGFGVAVNGFHWKTYRTVTGEVIIDYKSLKKTFRQKRRELLKKSIEGYKEAGINYTLADLKSIARLWSYGFHAGVRLTIEQFESEVDDRCRKEQERLNP